MLRQYGMIVLIVPSPEWRPHTTWIAARELDAIETSSQCAVPLGAKKCNGTVNSAFLVVLISFTLPTTVFSGLFVRSINLATMSYDQTTLTQRQEPSVNEPTLPMDTTSTTFEATTSPRALESTNGGGTEVTVTETEPSFCPQTPSSSRKTTSPATIAGSVIGSLAAVFVLALLFILWRRRKYRSRVGNNADEEIDDPTATVPNSNPVLRSSSASVRTVSISTINSLTSDLPRRLSQSSRNAYEEEIERLQQEVLSQKNYIRYMHEQMELTRSSSPPPSYRSSPPSRKHKKYNDKSRKWTLIILRALQMATASCHDGLYVCTNHPVGGAAEATAPLLSEETPAGLSSSMSSPLLCLWSRKRDEPNLAMSVLGSSSSGYYRPEQNCGNRKDAWAGVGVASRQPFNDAYCQRFDNRQFDNNMLTAKII
ncbi:hypothetical protein ARMGADRAFT_1028213 [Armillaria gallica]|uniref:Uncharacterized protein n=1 Tax=Armillaria gallica TaxID=47427 RepID=A0A2H3DQ22_ARMGA|nr:hypothetical protein ARMGADRAFT_1028213 [Armillaria gallica]